MTIPMIAQGPFRAVPAWGKPGGVWDVLDGAERVYVTVHGSTAYHDAPILADMLNEKARRDYRIQQDGR